MTFHSSPTVHSSEAGHWYYPDGRPAYEIIGKNGKVRATTLRDARTHGLYPSVTTIIKTAAAPGLEAWKQRQVMYAALTLPRRPDEDESAFITRVLDDSREEARRAAEAGTAVHTAIQQCYQGEPYAYAAHVTAFQDTIGQHFGHDCHNMIAERSFAHPMGFGGKADLHNAALLVDVKTKDAKDVEASDLDLYDEHLMQLAAYRVGLGIPAARCAIAFVSRTDPPKAVTVEADPARLEQGWNMFVALLTFWQAKTGHRPAVAA